MGRIDAARDGLYLLHHYTAATASWGEEEKMTSPRGRHIHSFLAPLIIYDGSTRHLSDQLAVVIVVVDVE